MAARKYFAFKIAAKSLQIETWLQKLVIGLFNGTIADPNNRPKILMYDTVRVLDDNSLEGVAVHEMYSALIYLVPVLSCCVLAAVRPRPTPTHQLGLQLTSLT